jgi:hypothetical protein
MIIDRDRRAWVPKEEIKRPLEIDAPDGAPEWAIWERELYRINQRVCHWIASRQREDGQFWGGWNDDPFIPLGFPSLPLLGDEVVRKSWLRFYDGLEEAGIFADGYCDIWPIDPLHITDFISSRGLMLAFGLGDPLVVERELRTSERYSLRVNRTNARLLAESRPPLSPDRSGRERKDVTLIEQMDAEILNYSYTHLSWYWGMTPAPEPYVLSDRNELARRMRDAVLSCDRITEFDFTESMIHTDGQGQGIGRYELIQAALGGSLQGRIQADPHSIAASWENDPGENLARLVTYAATDSLKINLYNFSEAPVETTMRVWRLEPGKYDLTEGPDLDDDGEIDAGSEKSSGERELQRFSKLTLSIPSRVNYAISLDQVESIEKPELLADLAISEEGVREEGNAVKIAIHNIGAGPAPEAILKVQHRSRGNDQTLNVPPMPSPVAGLHAQKVDVFVKDMALDEIAAIRIDPENQIDEILEDNNFIRFEERRSSREN